jgi:hypothetical protein
VDRHCFIDYEVFSDGRGSHWGTLAFTWHVANEADLSPEALIDQIRRVAAQRHAATAASVRVLALTRLCLTRATR